MGEEKVEKAKKNNIKFFICILGVLLIMIGCGFLISKSFNNDKNNKKDRDTTINNPDEKKEIAIDDDIIKLHEIKEGVRLSSFVIETLIYGKNVFDISELQNKDITFTYGSKIYENVKSDLEKLVKLDEYGEKYINEKDAEEVIKKGFQDLFSDNLSFNHEIMSGCHALSYHDGKYYIVPQCGDVSDVIAYIKLSKAEKDQSNIYIYEKVSIVTPDNLNTESKSELYVYKWTYNLKKDGNYYFLKAERV